MLGEEKVTKNEGLYGSKTSLKGLPYSETDQTSSKVAEADNKSHPLNYSRDERCLSEDCTTLVPRFAIPHIFAISDGPRLAM